MIYDFIYSLVVLTEKLAIFNKLRGLLYPQCTLPMKTKLFLRKWKSY